MIVQFCGLSGVGKTTLAQAVRDALMHEDIKCEIIDGDVYRKVFRTEASFAMEDRIHNIRCLNFFAQRFSSHGIVVLISAINPYDFLRDELKSSYPNSRLVYLSCSVENLIIRDTKGLYKRAFLPLGDPSRIDNLSGINDRFDIPCAPDLHIRTDILNLADSVSLLYNYICDQL